MICPICGAKNREASKFCMRCGAALTSEGDKAPPSQPSQPQAPATSPPPPPTPPPSYQQPGYPPTARRYPAPPPEAEHGIPYVPPPQGWPQPGEAAPSSSPYGPAYPQANQGAYVPTYAPVAQAPPKKRRPWLALVIGAGVIVVLLIAGFFVLPLIFPDVALFNNLALPSLLPEGQHALLGIIGRDERIDLYLLKMGRDFDKGVELAEEVEFSFYGEVDMRRQVGARSQAFGYMGGFVPDTKRLIYWYNEDEDLVLETIKVGEKAPSEMISSDAFPIYGVVYQDRNRVFFREARSDQERCYAGDFGEEAERVIKGDGCDVTGNGTFIFAKEWDYDDDEFSLTMIGIDGKDETVVLDAVESVEDMVVSYNGDTIAYVQEIDPDEQQLMCTSRSGEDAETIVDEVFAIDEFGFLDEAGSIVYYTVRDEDNVLSLYTTVASDALAETEYLYVIPALNRSIMIYLTEDSDGEEAVYAYDARADENVELLRADDLDFRVVDVLDKIFLRVRDDDEITLYSADMNGDNLVEILEESNVTSSEIIVDPRNTSMIFVRLRDEDSRWTLYAIPNNKSDPIRLMEEWHSLSLLNWSESAKLAIVAAIEDSGDDPELYTITLDRDADQVLLDNNQNDYINAVFSANEKSIFFTASTGDDTEDLAVFKVGIGGKEDPELLYDNTILLSVQWDELFNPLAYYWY